MKRVLRGHPLSISASDWNRIVDFTLGHELRGASGRVALDPTAITAKNETDSRVNSFSVVGLESYSSPSTAQILFRAVVPDRDAHSGGRWGIAQEPSLPGGVFRVVPRGLSAARVRMVDESHRCADIDESGELASTSHGSALILTKQAIEDRDDAEYAWCYLLLGATSGESFYLACGMFSGAGTIEAHNIAVGDGSRWYNYNTPITKNIDPEYHEAFDLPFRTGIVNDAAVFGGELYICGTIRINPRITSAPALEFDEIHLAKWSADDGEWVDVANGFDDLFFYPGTASALLVYDGALLIGGLNDVTNVVRFDGSSFSDFGAVSGGQALGQVNILADWNGWVYAGTTGSAGFSVSGASLLRSGGGAWESVGADVPTGATHTLELHDDGTGEKLYVGGAFTQVIGSITRRHIARWTGSAWEHLWIRSSQSGFANVSGAQVRALCSYRGALLIGGQNLSPGPLCAVWDGRRINSQVSQLRHHSSGGSTPTSFVRSIVRYGEGVLYGGQFFVGTMADLGIEVRRVCALNVSDDVYERLPGDGFDGTVHRIIEFGGQTYAVGEFSGHFARRTQTGWELLIDPGVVFSAEIVTWNGSDRLALAGPFGIQLWDGDTLEALVTSSGIVRKIRAESEDSLIAVGNFTAIDSTSCAGVARITYDSGVDIDPLATTIDAPGGQWDVRDVAFDSTYIYVVGRITSIGNSEGTDSSIIHVARMSKATRVWSNLGTSGTEPNTQCYSCEIFGGNLYVGQDGSSVKMWNGSTWSIPGSGNMLTNRAPELLRVVDGELLVDAQSSSDGRTRLVAWNGITVRTIAHGNPASADNGLFDAPIHTAAVIGEELVIGGAFIFAGTLRSDAEEVPAQCLVAMNSGYRWEGHLGGIGEKLAGSAAQFGTATWVHRVRILSIPGLAEQSVVAVGDFSCASDVRCNGIAAQTLNRARAIGLGVGPISTTSPVAGTISVNDAIRMSDGKMFAAGSFSFGRNLRPDPKHEEAGGIVRSPALIEIAKNRTFLAAPGHDLDAGVDAISFPVKRDTWVNQQTPQQNYGSATTLTVGVASGESQHALLYVDLRDLGSVNGADIGSAVLNLACETPRTSDFDARVSVLLPAPWGENAITWDDFSAEHSVVDSAAINFPAPASTGSFSVNITSLIRWFLDSYGAIPMTLILRKAESGNGSFRVYSREATDAANRPNLSIEVRSKDFTEIFAVEEFGDEDGTPLLWASHNGAQRISRYNHATHEWIRRGNNIEQNNFVSVGLIRFGDHLYHYGSARLTASPSVDRVLVRTTGDGTWEDVSPPDMMTCNAACVAVFDGTPTLVVGGQMAGSQNSIWSSTDGATWSPVGPVFSGMPAPEGAARVSCNGLAWVDFSRLGSPHGWTLVATALTIGASDSSSNVYYAAFYDAAAAAWKPTAAFSGLAGFWRAHSVSASALALVGFSRTPQVIARNPNSGKITVDSLAEWNPRDGWRRLGGQGGMNDAVYRARG